MTKHKPWTGIKGCNFTAQANRWLDRINGNTYHSVRIIRHSDHKTIFVPFQYGYGDAYRDSALKAMLKAGWLPKKYTNDNLCMYERQEQYPVIWIVSNGLKRDCISNGKDQS